MFAWHSVLEVIIIECKLLVLRTESFFTTMVMVFVLDMVLVTGVKASRRTLVKLTPIYEKIAITGK